MRAQMSVVALRCGRIGGMRPAQMPCREALLVAARRRRRQARAAKSEARASAQCGAVAAACYGGSVLQT